MNTAEAEAIFAEFEIKIVPKNVMPQIGETRAVVSLQRIIKRHSLDHGRFVVMTLADTNNNKGAITETTLWCISDMVKATERNFPSVLDKNIEHWFRFWDGIPLGWLEHWCLDVDGLMPKRYILGGMCWERLRRQFGGLAIQPDLLDDRRKVTA